MNEKEFNASMIKIQDSFSASIKRIGAQPVRSVDPESDEALFARTSDEERSPCPKMEEYSECQGCGACAE